MAKFNLMAFLCFISSIWMGSASQQPININLTVYLVSTPCETSIKSMSINAKVDETRDVQKKVNPCQSNPCLYESSCEETEDQTDYICQNCSYPIGGKNCADLVCSPNCFRVDDKIYFVYPDHKTNRLEGYLKCEEEGMTMAMIKDQTTHDKVKDFFLGYAPDRNRGNRCYWIGLNRTSPSHPYKWADGTRLGTQIAVNTDYVPTEPCVSTCSGSWGYLIYSDYCNGYPGFEYFSFCQMRYPFLNN